MNRHMWSLALSGAIVLVGCAGGPRADAGPEPVGTRVAVAGGGGYWDVSVTELQGMLADKDFPLVNVHVPFQGNLPSTDLSIPYNEIAAHLGELPSDREAPIVLYCRSGPMSVEAAEVLAGLGYTNVYSLVGGFNAWRAAGLPMAQP